MNLILIGYWVNKSKYMFEESKKYADPTKLQDKSFWESRDKAGVIAYLESGSKVNQYKGMSSCRICQQGVGSSERSDGTYAWPDRMEHYIKEHDLKIPEEFYEHIKANSFKVPESGANMPMYGYRFDETFWIEWSKKYLTDFEEKTEDIALRARAAMEKRPMVVQETIERGAKDIQEEIDNEILKDLEKKFTKKGMRNG